MAVKQVQGLITVQVLTIEDGYEDVVSGRKFTKSSDWSDRWKLGFQYCAERGATPLTLDDTVWFRHDTGGMDYSDERQLTGTFIGLVSDGRAGLRAHVYDPSAEELLDIAKSFGNDDRYVDVAQGSVLERKFVDGGRTFPVPANDLVLSVEADASGKSVYSENHGVRSLMPKNAATNAAIIKGKGYDTGRVWFYHPALPKGTMRILPVGLGGVGCSDVYGIDADGNVDGGRARGLVHGA